MSAPLARTRGFELSGYRDDPRRRASPNKGTSHANVRSTVLFGLYLLCRISRLCRPVPVVDTPLANRSAGEMWMPPVFVRGGAFHERGMWSMAGRSRATRGPWDSPPTARAQVASGRHFGMRRFRCTPIPRSLFRPFGSHLMLGHPPPDTLTEREARHADSRPRPLRRRQARTARSA